MRFLINISYDGTDFHGYQKQKGKRSVEEELEIALTRINNGKLVKVCASGRTDKGVHALSQFLHADIDVKITPNKLKRAMNTFLPDDIHVLSTKIVSNDFNARYNVLEKTYEYFIETGEYNPIQRNYIYQYNYDLDVEAMKEAIGVFVGEHDFRAFVTENKTKENCVREITSAFVASANGLIKIVFTGNGFMRYQVRNMVGTLLRIGQNKLTIDELVKILESKDRTKACKTAPAEGLYLVSVKYKDNI